MPALAPFKLERYFARYEFKAQYLLSASDCESLSLRELLALADADSRERWEALSLGYTESPGHPVLRAEVARLYQTLTPDDVLVLTPEEGIYIALHTLLEPGDHVVAVTPAYQSLHAIARSRGCALTAWPVALGAEGWRLDLEQLTRSLTPATRLLVINFPHNPTGFLPTRADLDAILALAAERKLYVFSDEMYRLLELDPAQRLPAVCDVYARGVSLSGLSKTFALPGLRLGWLATRDRGLLERCLQLKDYTTICHSAPSEILGLMALRAAGAILARNLDILRANLRHAAGFFGQTPALFRWLPPQAGSIAFPAWTGPGSVEALSQAAVEQHGVMLAPGSLFEDEPRLSAVSQHFRVGLGRRNFPEALRQLQTHLQAAGLV